MATTTTYAQLNIGRNVGDVPMTDDRWDWFISTAESVIADAWARVHGSRIGVKTLGVQVHLGAGEWNGVHEESAHISLFHANGMDADYITEQASVMATMFEQDAVAVIIGSTLAEPF